MWIKEIIGDEVFCIKTDLSRTNVKLYLSMTIRSDWSEIQCLDIYDEIIVTMTLKNFENVNNDTLVILKSN